MTMRHVHSRDPRKVRAANALRASEGLGPGIGRMTLMTHDPVTGHTRGHLYHRATNRYRWVELVLDFMRGERPGWLCAFCGDAPATYVRVETIGGITRPITERPMACADCALERATASPAYEHEGRAMGYEFRPA